MFFTVQTHTQNYNQDLSAWANYLLTVQLTFVNKMIASVSVTVFVLLLSSVGFAAELSLTLLNDAVDKVFNKLPSSPR